MRNAIVESLEVERSSELQWSKVQWSAAKAENGLKGWGGRIRTRSS